MASDKHDESRHRKHRRSSSSDDEADKSSKRHKARHHKHHHRHHHHRHHRDKKHDDENQLVGDESVPAADATCSPPPAAPVGASDGGDDEVEEGEILEEEGLVEILKKRSDSDGESGEIKTGQVRDDNLPVDDVTHSVGGFLDDKNHEKAVRQGKLGTPNGDSAHESEREDKRWYKESGSPSWRGGKKSNYNSYAGELDRSRVSDNRSSFSSEGSEEKDKITRSPSNSRYPNEVRGRSRSRSHDRGREIWSHSVAEEEFAGRRRHRDASRDHRYDTIDSCRNEEKYYRYGRYVEEDRHHSREVCERGRSRERDIDKEERKRDGGREGSRYREIDSDRRRERERERRREIEADRERRKEYERDHNLDRERRRERDHVRDRDRDRDRARYSSREGEREKEKERRSDKERDRGLEILIDREKRKSLDEVSDDIRHKQSRHSKNGAEDDLDIIRRLSLKTHSSRGDDSETRGQSRRDEDDQDDNEEGVIWALPEQEEEELNRIKEESRKRRQAILEKYKKQQVEQQSDFSSQDKGKDMETGGTPDQSSNGMLNVRRESDDPDPVTSASFAAANVGQAENATDSAAVSADFAESSLMVGKSPQQQVIPDTGRTLAPAGLGEGTPKSEGSADMFRDDIFGESPAGTRKTGHLPGKGDGLPVVRSGLHDNWDDAEGYYSYQFGELVDGRYEVTATHGKGVFSTVVRAKDVKAGPDELGEVAIKIIRNNETMHKAGQTEVQILKKLAGADPENRRHCVRFLSSFKYRNHLCLVFESLHLNLREVLKKFGRNIGLKLTAVRAYAKQLFIALKHLKNCGVLHCDIKPDNMLVNEAKNVLKLCDFGNAMFAGKNEVTPYLVSRFYRAPEIILGLPYDHPLDIWSVGCCLYELYSGKVLFPGPTNNDMLRLHMELKGPFPKKMLRKGAFTHQHFDQDLNFHAIEDDPVTAKTTKRMIVNIKPKDIGSVIKGYPGEDPKMLAHFKDLLDKIFVLDPERRLTVSQALAHPFITGK